MVSWEPSTRVRETAMLRAGHRMTEYRPLRQNVETLLRGDGGVHPAVLHHAMRRTEAEIVHMIGNIGPAVDYARGNDQRVTDLQLDFARANRQSAATRTVW